MDQTTAQPKKPAEGPEQILVEHISRFHAAFGEESSVPSPLQNELTQAYGHLLLRLVEGHFSYPPSGLVPEGSPPPSLATAGTWLEGHLPTVK